MAKEQAKKDKVFQEAKNGGAYTRIYKQYKDRPVKEIENAAKGYKRQVDLHRDKIDNPKKHYAGWEARTDEEKARDFRDWHKDIFRNEKHQWIMEGLLKERRAKQ